MNKTLKILIAGVFLAGFISSVICLACKPHIAAGCCHSKTQPPKAGDESCFSHCLKQKISAVNVENKLLEKSEGERQSFDSSLKPKELQISSIYFKFNPYYLNKPVFKLSTGQVWFTPLLNHAPPVAF